MLACTEHFQRLPRQAEIPCRSQSWDFKERRKMMMPPQALRSYPLPSFWLAAWDKDEKPDEECKEANSARLGADFADFERLWLFHVKI